MPPLHIVTIVGARPQFIKAAVVSRAIHDLNTTGSDVSQVDASAPNIRETIVHTGQHYDANMSDVFFDELNIPRPDHNLGIGGGSHGQNTGRMLESIEGVLQAERPDWVLVYGDTDSTLAGTLAAVKLHIPVAHVEAGLRSFNRRMPEEINRVLTDHAASLLFTPTDLATSNLASEGISGDQVCQAGDVMYDAALYYSSMADQKSDALSRLGLLKHEYILATIHRAENTDDPKRMREILKGLSSSPLPIVWPIHPRTRKRLQEFGLSIPPSVREVEPVGYLDMVSLERNAKIICTDSGGVQKEAYFHGVPCVTLRDETEWAETVNSGWNQLVGADSDLIIGALKSFDCPNEPHNASFGNGRSAKLIAQRLA